jgi:2-C-methyl-D-erythritol 4-phosphate cytidylyltransferase/2-C-methyl-D-erythritol 2,4-cyclodiphosphate synthase
MAVRVAAIVVAAGRGLRAGGEIPKQYRPIAGVAPIRTSLRLFSEHPDVGIVLPVVHPDDAALFQSAVAGMAMLPAVAGGATRQESVCAGLEALVSHDAEIVLVHDAARPFASPALVARAIAAAVEHGAAIPGVPISDTVKSLDDTGLVTGTLDRSQLRYIQTPQAVSFRKLLAAHRRAREAELNTFTDDAAIAEWAGMPVTIFEGEQGNVKLTTDEDFRKAEASSWTQFGDVRAATGYDVHAFGDGDHVMLGGVRIPHTHGLTGHSDADVGLHALVDAILGALADGDIGQHFPPSDPQWKGASSDRFLAYAMDRVRQRQGRVAQLDVTIVCEAPRVGPHRDAIRQRIAEIAGVPIDRVSVKATTSEQLGFTGRREGIAALATATIRLPWSGP